MSRARHLRSDQRSLWQVFRIPIVLAMLSVFGLISALVGDEHYDILSWLALVVLPLIIVWMLWVRPQSRAR